MISQAFRSALADGLRECVDASASYEDDLLAICTGLAPGSVALLDIEHEHGCPRPDGGACDCRPRISIRQG